MLLYTYIMINMNMKKVVAILFAILFLTACSVKNPALDFGKKCVVDGDQVVYSYVWVYDKSTGLKATKEQCNQIAE